MFTHILIAVAIYYFLPDHGAALQWERCDGFGLSWWSGHYVHWSAGHLFWDCLMFATFGFLAQRLYGLRLHLAFLATAPLLTLGTYTLIPEVGTYRGLSGFDTVLFTFVCIRLFHDAFRNRETGNALIAAAMLLGLTGKTIYEIVAARPLFAQDLGPEVVPLPEIHLIGAVLGAVIAIWPNPRTTVRSGVNPHTSQVFVAKGRRPRIEADPVKRSGSTDFALRATTVKNWVDTL